MTRKKKSNRAVESARVTEKVKRTSKKAATEDPETRARRAEAARLRGRVRKATAKRTRDPEVDLVKLYPNEDERLGVLEKVVELSSAGFRDARVARALELPVAVVRELLEEARRRAIERPFDLKVIVSRFEARYDARRRDAYQMRRGALERVRREQRRNPDTGALEWAEVPDPDFDLALRVLQAETAIDREHVSLLATVGYLTEVAANEKRRLEDLADAELEEARRQAARLLKEAT